MAGNKNSGPGKGKSNNPAGTQKLPPELNMELKMSSAEFKRLVNKNYYRTREQWKQTLADPNTIGLELAVITILAKAVEEGDQKRLEMLLDRTIGKVSQDITFGGLALPTSSVQVVVTIPSNGFDQIGGPRDVTPNDTPTS